MQIVLFVSFGITICPRRSRVLRQVHIVWHCLPISFCKSIYRKMKTAEEFEPWPTLIVKDTVLHILATAFKTLKTCCQFFKFKPQTHVVKTIVLKPDHGIDKWESVFISPWLCSRNVGLSLSRICMPKGINLLFAYCCCLFPFLYSCPPPPPLPFHDQPISLSYT